MKMKTFKNTIMTLALACAAVTSQAETKDVIYIMPADSKHVDYYLPNEAQPEKGSVADAAQCLKACEANNACVVWSFKPGHFGAPNSCKLSPALMKEKGETMKYAGASAGVIQSR